MYFHWNIFFPVLAAHSIFALNLWNLAFGLFHILCYNFAMYLGEDFKKFLEPQTNRRDFILNWLSARGVKTAVMPIDGHEHICVVFPKESYSPLFKIKTVIAHYDIFPGSPGANDNTSSVFCLMNWAARLYNSGIWHNVRLIFTDGEEIASVRKDSEPAQKSFSAENPVSAQGAFGLANVFKRLNIVDDDVYVFDCVGRGTVPVLSKSFVPLKAGSKFRNSFFSIESRIARILRSSCDGKFVSLPVPYSDNAGFLAHGIAAVAVTMLPVDEANEYMFNLVRFPYLEDFVLNRKVPQGVEKSFLEKMIPASWKKFHTRQDNFDSLTEESFVMMEKILQNLAVLKIPC